MDVASWTIASILTFLSQDEAKSDIATLRSRTKHRQAKSDVASLHPRQCCTMSKTKQNPTSQLSVHGPTSSNQVKYEEKSNVTSHRAWTKHVFPYPSRGTSSSQMRGVCKLTLMPSSTPSSEDDVLSRPAKETMTPSSVAAPEQFWEHVLLPYQ